MTFPHPDPDNCDHVHRSTDIDTGRTECDDCGAVLHAGSPRLPPRPLDAFAEEPATHHDEDGAPTYPGHREEPSWPAVTDPKMPVGLIFKSTSESYPHIVGVVNAQKSLYLTCTCKAFLSIGVRPEGCWAMQRARAILLTDAPQS